jgi:hypothetical protein
LPPAIEQGSTLREVTWGVDSIQDLEDLAARLADVEGLNVLKIQFSVLTQMA